MKAKALSGNKEIIDSGFIILGSEDSELTLKVPFSEGFDGELHFTFVESADQGGVKTESVDGKDNALHFTCRNFGTSNGAHTVMPIEIGEDEGHKLLIHLWSAIDGPDGNRMRRFQYTIYKECSNE